MMDLLPSLLPGDARLLQVELSLAAVLFLVSWWWLRGVVPKPGAKRVAALLGRVQGDAQRVNEPRRSLGATISHWSIGAIKRLKLQSSVRDEALLDRLVRAGLRQASYRYVFILAQVVLPALFTVLAVTYVTMSYGWRLPQVAAATLVGVALGYYAPIVFINNRAARRRLALQRTIPDGLDLLVVCTEAGLSMDAAFNRVAAELGPAAPELADELSLTAVELNFLPDRRQALVNLGRRADIPTFSSVVSTLVQSERYGTPLSQSLRVLAADFREQRLLAAEEKAARLPATLTVPMIVFILPTLFIVLLGPAILQVYDNFVRH